MRRLASSLILLSACAGHLRTERVGTGVATVAPRGTAPVIARGIELPAGDYDLKLRFDLPRAQLVEWHVACAGASSDGSVGEPFDAYRRRRLAQLAADREHERAAASTIAGVLVGAVAPSVGVHAQGPNGTVDARVDGQAAGNAAGAAVANSYDMTVQLPPGDVGAGPVGTLVHVTTTAPGACTVTAVADDPNVLGGFEVVRIRDLDAEARERAIAADRHSREARAQIASQLVDLGADPMARRRQAEARAAVEAREGAALRARAEAELRVNNEAIAARARADAEARATAELALRTAADARRRQQIAIEVHVREVSLEARARLRAQLIVWGADPELRARLELEARARAEAEAHARAVAEARAGAELRLRAEAELRITAEAEARRRAELAMVIEIRMRLRAQLIAWGADPELRAHLALRARQEREAREARLRVEIQIREAHDREERARIDGQLAAAELERTRLEARRLELAMTARTELRAYLVSIGARERPPMPAMVAEVRGEAPFAGAAWVEGHWNWTGTEWSWIAGGWRDASVTFGAAGGEAPIAGTAVIETPVAVPVVIDTVQTVGPVIDVRDQRTIDVRDHRTITVAPPHTPPPHTAPPPRSTPTVRDHRDPPKSPDPKVRDHRR